MPAPNLVSETIVFQPPQSLSTCSISSLLEKLPILLLYLGIFVKSGFSAAWIETEGVKFPRKWHIILINDKSIKGTSGLTEEKFFKASLDYYNHKKLSNELTNILLRGLCPAILYNDFDNFSKCLHEFQKNTSKFYFKNQKKFFLSDDIDKVMKYVLKSGYPGIGQSSWGPISYIFMRSKNEAKDLIKSMENKFKLYNNLSYHVVGANNSGHSIKTIEPKE